MWVRFKSGATVCTSDLGGVTGALDLTLFPGDHKICPDPVALVPPTSADWSGLSIGEICKLGKVSSNYYYY